ncbi:DUF7001 family protein [Natronosalvus rutilus]|uniref:Uncharacterized protein n=1 Tax=Natronosalvus rutilus TaxID=2953753 RepID=A0A9E7SV52_9EURY|nr:DUF6775 family putative metallopeptidase [Natronosalvus rutilus]UTF53547.1 hypothetical protein NGM29_17540 [Natronosalvus rutilus]
MVDHVAIYRAPTTVVDADAVAAWLEPRLEASITVRERFLDDVRGDELAERFAAARIRGPRKRETGNTMLGTVRYEKRALEHPEREGGVLYDGAQIARALNRELPADERGLKWAHVVLLDRALATWGDHDGRWHKRVTVPGQPALVSVPGLYEAPAKPKSYYQEQQRRALVSGDVPPREILERDVADKFLLEDDPRTTDAICGFVLQAAHYLETGEPFCAEPTCRLYNAHTHEGVVRAQLSGTAFCADHGAVYANVNAEADTVDGPDADAEADATGADVNTDTEE